MPVIVITLPLPSELTVQVGIVFLIVVIVARIVKSFIPFISG